MKRKATALQNIYDLIEQKLAEMYPLYCLKAAIAAFLSTSKRSGKTVQTAGPRLSGLID